MSNHQAEIAIRKMRNVLQTTKPQMVQLSNIGRVYRLKIPVKRIRNILPINIS